MITSKSFPDFVSSCTSSCSFCISNRSLSNISFAGIGQSRLKAADFLNCSLNWICLLLKAMTCMRTHEASFAIGVEICCRQCSASFLVWFHLSGRLCWNILNSVEIDSNKDFKISSQECFLMCVVICTRIRNTSLDTIYELWLCTHELDDKLLSALSWTIVMSTHYSSLDTIHELICTRIRSYASLDFIHELPYL